MNNAKCQLYNLPDISNKLGVFAIARQRLIKLRSALRRRVKFIINLFYKTFYGKAKQRLVSTVSSAHSELKAGDLVKIRSMKEIQSTLNNWNQLKGCTFLDEMRAYCGTVQKIKKRVNRFLNEADYLVKKCKGIVILENVFCEGTKAFGPCDRSCFFFWREEWLEKIKQPNVESERKK